MKIKSHKSLKVIKSLKVSILAFLVISTCASSQLPAKCEEYPVKFEYKSNIQKLCNQEYTSFYNTNFRAPELVVEIIEPKDFRSGYVRDADFKPDPRVRNSPRPAEYSRSGYDRGHMSAASNTTNPKTIQESFLTTNVNLQSPELNRGLWKTLERYTKIKGHSSRVLVISGVYFNSCYTPRRFNNIAIPDGFWKIIQIDNQQPLAWKFPNSKIIPGKLENYRVSLDQVPKTCSVDFNW